MVSDLRGSVVDYFTGQPVRGASVLLDDVFSATDPMGRFSFVDVESRRYALRVLHRDYEEYRTTVDLSRPGFYEMPPIRIKPIFKAL